MPLVPFDTLPDDARVWVFGSDAPVAPERTAPLLDAVDGFLSQWNAHGNPLTSARAWADDHFLIIGVDQSTAGASGCSIDGLFRTLRALESEIGASLLGGGRVFYRGADGRVRSVDRAAFTALGADGTVSASTPVLDPTVETKRDLRERFERPASAGWEGELLASAR
jgi:hypothetical protein